MERNGETQNTGEGFVFFMVIGDTIWRDHEADFVEFFDPANCS